MSTEPTIHGEFERLASIDPGSPAVEMLGQKVSYGELNEMANRISADLIARGLPHGSLVAICLERSVELIAAILASWKAGCAYVPLDPAFPQSRRAHLVTDSGARLVLTSEAVPEEGAAYGEAEQVAVEECLKRDPRDFAARRPTDSSSLAYVMYTSGSSGAPKGVLVEHASVCNLAAAERELLGIGPGDRVMQYAPITFDTSVSEILAGILSGATLCLAPRSMLIGAAGCSDVLRETRATVATLTPAVLAVSDPDLPHLRTIISAGESCPLDLARRWAEGRRYINAYGATEGTVATSWAVYEQPPTEISIGFPLRGRHLYVVDEKLELLPDGEEGELMIGGRGVARGYLNRTELTADRFLTDLWQGGGRMYRTGDRGSRSEDGRFWYHGRGDEQLKVRGIRIEPGEVEAVLRTHPRVLAAHVFGHGRGAETLLVAAVVVADGQLGERELRMLAAHALPSYMTPNRYILLDEMPRTSHGKVNRQQLVGMVGGHA